MKTRKLWRLKYLSSVNSIDQVEILNESPLYLTWRVPGERSIRQRKGQCLFTLHATWQSAHSALVMRAEEQIANAESAMATLARMIGDNRQTLAAIRALTEPTKTK